jgi:hypothetical protein
MLRESLPDDAGRARSYPGERRETWEDEMGEIPGLYSAVPINFRSNMHTPETRARAYAKTQERRVRWFKDHGPCACGSWSDLELHHVNPETKVSHRIWSWCNAKREAELAKCVAFCSACHKAITAQQTKTLFTLPQKEWKHGTLNTYNRRGCRCIGCREYKHQVYLRQREKKK